MQVIGRKIDICAARLAGDPPHRPVPDNTASLVAPQHESTVFHELRPLVARVEPLGQAEGETAQQQRRPGGEVAEETVGKL